MITQLDRILNHKILFFILWILDYHFNSSILNIKNKKIINILTMNEQYDAIVLGTGLKECILAGLLAKLGKLD